MVSLSYQCMHFFFMIPYFLTCTFFPQFLFLNNTLGLIQGLLLQPSLEPPHFHFNHFLSYNFILIAFSPLCASQSRLRTLSSDVLPVPVFPTTSRWTPWLIFRLRSFTSSWSESGDLYERWSRMKAVSTGPPWMLKSLWGGFTKQRPRRGLFYAPRIDCPLCSLFAFC